MSQLAASEVPTLGALIVIARTPQKGIKKIGGPGVKRATALLKLFKLLLFEFRYLKT